MSETELERIVVRLVGDGSSYQQMMATAVQATQETARKVAEAGRRIEGIKNNLVSFASTAVRALGAFGIATSLRGAFDAYEKLQEGQIRLRNILIATGQDVTVVTARFQRLAQQINDTTLITKGEVFQLAQRASMMGLNADAAERVVRNSVALAGATGREAEGMLRAANAVERGNYQLAYRMVVGRGAKASQEEMVRVINNMIAAGTRIQEEIANTATGRMERLGRSLKLFTVELGGALAGLLEPFVKVVQQATDILRTLDDESKKAIAKILGVTLGLLALGPALRVLHELTWPLVGITKMTVSLVAFTVIQTYSIAKWLIYKAVVLAANAVMLVYKSIMFIVTSGQVIATIVMLAWSAAAAVGKIITLGLAAAMMVLNAAMALNVVGLVAFVAAVALVGAALSLIAAAVTAVVGVAGALLTILGNLPTTAGPLGAVGRAFGEWGEILSTIWKGLQTNLPAAMNLIRASFSLLVNQVKDMWAPLWRGITGAAQAVARNIGILFDSIMLRARMSQVRMNRQAVGLSTTEIDRRIGVQDRHISQVTQEMGRQVNRAFTRATVTDSAATIEARRAVRAAMEEINRISDEAGIPRPGDGGQAPGGKDKHIEHKDSALRFSAEGFARISEYLEKTPGSEYSDPQLPFLRRMANGIDRIAGQPPVEVEEVEI